LSLWQPGEFVDINSNPLVPTAFNYDHAPFRDYNLRATTVKTPRVSFCYSSSDGNSFAELPPYRSGYTLSGDLDTAFTTQLASPHWGWMLSAGTERVVLYDVPRRWETGSPPLASLGQLQHASLTADNEAPQIGHQPAYAVGNSFYSPYVARDRAVHANRPFQFSFTSSLRTTASSDTKDTYFDISYLLNTALWDGFYFSTVWPNAAQLADTAILTNDQLPNARLKPVFGTPGSATGANLRANAFASAHYLGIDGAFNVNSTSVEAWAAMLAGTKGLHYPNDTGLQAIFARTSNQPVGAKYSATDVSQPTGQDENSYAGLRRLNDATVRTLATEIVKQVRLRGPFLSLAHFINRTLVASTNSANATQDFGLMGPLQAAVENAGINDLSALANANGTDSGDWVLHYGVTKVGPSFGLYADYANDYAVQQGRRGHRTDAIPGRLTQADLLQALGPVLGARSDSFIIRTYGEVKSPVSGETTGRAWCEASVQRLPEYVNASADSAELAPPYLTDTDNKTFGRRFKIVSFRWLAPDDI
jgi:hypothetical protein